MAPAAVLTTVALAAPAASAGTTPVPGPVASAQSQVQSQMRHHHRFRPEFFTIRVVNRGNENNNGDVNAFGPVRGMAADIENSNNVQSLFDFGDGSTVNVFHTDVNNVNPQIDLRSCTATADATGFWAFLGGTGRYSRALGTGQFRFSLFLQFKRHHHHCRITMHTQPELTVVNVTAFGRARR
jgi:hypothetical protein